jgi:hypothetical protein
MMSRYDMVLPAVTAVYVKKLVDEGGNLALYAERIIEVTDAIVAASHQTRFKMENRHESVALQSLS